MGKRGADEMLDQAKERNYDAENHDQHSQAIYPAPRINEGQRRSEVNQQDHDQHHGHPGSERVARKRGPRGRRDPDRRQARDLPLPDAERPGALISQSAVGWYGDLQSRRPGSTGTLPRAKMTVAAPARTHHHGDPGRRRQGRRGRHARAHRQRDRRPTLHRPARRSRLTAAAR